MAFIESFNRVERIAYNQAKAKGFWDKERNFGEIIALIHSELSEALEADRKGNPKSKKIPDFSHVEEEFADVIIRIMDISHSLNFRVAEALITKLEYNNKRQYKHGKKY